MDKFKKLENLKEKIAKELICTLKDKSINMVFGKGNPSASIMFIGEAPGEKEDLSGLPFVGRAGKELDKFLNTINLTIDDVYIANILKYRPPKNRNPKKSEIMSHTPYLIEQIKIIEPKVICTLGNYSTKFVLSNFDVDNMKNIEGIAQLHGKLNIIFINNKETKVIPIYHPAAMLYKPSLKIETLEDFQKIKLIIE